MSFNLRYGTAQDDENSWKYRKDIMVDVLSEYYPDIIGTQEGLKFQLEYITSAIPEYKFFGVSRQGTDEDEFCAIIYNSHNLEMVDGSNFWLSENPDIPGSQSWKSSLPRMVTWVLFKTEEENRFYHYNVHLDHRSEEARNKGSLLIWQRVKSHEDNLPVILTGDFNTTRSLIWNFLTGKTDYQCEQPNFNDTWDVALSKKGDVKHTYHGFMGKEAEENRKEQTTNQISERSFIDWILFRGELFVEYAEIVTYNKDGRYPSDHYPVYAKLKF